MSTTAYEHILQELEQLTPEERRRLRATLAATEAPGAGFVSADELRQILAQPPQPLSEHERAALQEQFQRSDELAARIGAAWKGDMNAVEAVREQRRDL